MSLFLARTVAGGRRAGIAAMTGASLGNVVHSVLAAFGLSALIAASPSMFLALKIVGAAYLLWLAVDAVRNGSSLNVRVDHPQRVALWPTLALGLTVNLTNPKVVLFYLTFLPQFVDAHDPHATGKLLFLGIYFVVLAYPLGLLADPGRGAGRGRPQGPTARPARHRLVVRMRVRRVRVAHSRRASTMTQRRNCPLRERDAHASSGRRAAQGRARLHLRHRVARRHRARHRHPGAAQADREHAGRRHTLCRAALRPFRHGVGTDAIPVLAGAGRAFRSLRPPPRAACLHDRAWPRLYPDGAGAPSRLAARRTDRLRHHLGELLHRLRLPRRRDRAREARRRLRHGRRRLRHRLRAGAGAGRHPRQRRSAPALLGGRRLQPGQCALRLFRAAGVAAARRSACPSAGDAPTPSARCACWRSIRSCWDWQPWPSSIILPTSCCRPPRCSTPAIATAGTT